MTKLPPALRAQVARKTASELWEINDILEISRQELEALAVGVMENITNLFVAKIIDHLHQRFQKIAEEVEENKSKTQNLATATTSNDLPSKVLLQTETTHAYAANTAIKLFLSVYV